MQAGLRRIGGEGRRNHLDDAGGVPRGLAVPDHHHLSGRQLLAGAGGRCRGGRHGWLGCWLVAARESGGATLQAGPPYTLVMPPGRGQRQLPGSPARRFLWRMWMMGGWGLRLTTSRILLARIYSVCPLVLRHVMAFVLHSSCWYTNPVNPCTHARKGLIHLNFGSV